MLLNENISTRSRVHDSFVVDSTCGAWCSLVRVPYCGQPCLVHTSASGTRLPKNWLVGIEAVNMRICHDEEHIACFDLSQTSFGSISCSSAFALVFLGVSWVPISDIHGCIRD